MAIDCDSNSDTYKTNRPSLFLFGEDQKLHLIKNCKENDGIYECCKIYDFQGHKMDDIIANDWDLCDMTSEAITYNDIVFQVSTEE